MSNNNAPNGMTYPTVQAPLAGNPNASAMTAMSNRNASQASLSSAVTGGTKKKGGATTVPQFTMSYKTTGGVGQDPNAVITQNAGISTQGAANSKYDALAQQGGNRCKKGGNPDWLWGCSSGGKKRRTRTNKRRTRTNKRKTRRYRKKTRRN